MFYITVFILSFGLLFINLPSILYFFIVVIYILNHGNNQTKTIIFLLANGIIGVYLNAKGLPYVVTISNYLFLLYLFFRLQIFKSKYNYVIFSFFLFYIINALSSTYINNSTEKFFNIFITFFSSLVFYFYLLKNYDLLDFKKLAKTLIVLILFSYVYSFEIFGIPNNVNIFNYVGYYRTTTFESSLIENKLNYQFLGYLLNLSLIFLLFSKTTRLEFLILSNIVLLLLLFSFSRQNVLIHLLVLYTNWVSSKFSGTRIILSVILFILIIPATLGYLSSIDSSELFSSLYNSENILESSGRDRLLSKGLSTFVSYPVFGIGLSSIELDGILGVYPHNILVEILAETGIIGLIFLIIFFVIHKFQHKLMVLQNKNLLKFFLYNSLVLFSVALVSGSMIQNVRIFALFFAPLLLTRGIKKFSIPSIRFEKS